VAALLRAARERPLDRRLVVAPTFGAGRELLRQVARAGHGWVGFEVTTPRPLSLRIARPAMAAEGLQLLDPFGQQAYLDEALDGALASGPDAGFGELSEGVGFREAVHGSVTGLRLAGVTPRDVRSAPFRDRRKRSFLARVLERYETLLRERHRADTATVLELALAALDRTPDRIPPSLGADEVLLVAGLGSRGLAGRFLSSLLGRGARVLPADPVIRLPTPDALLWRDAEPGGTLSWLHAPDDAPASGTWGEVDRAALFRAASVTDELREVLRRVVAGELRWDEVEIVASDATAYGSALHALATRLRIPVTFAVGLPVERTRPGRATGAYLDWIEGGFQAAPIRRLLEAGDLRPPRHRKELLAPADLARRFRGLRIGWGRLRYRSQLREALAAVEGLEPGKWEAREGFQRRVRRTRAELEALRSILFPTLKATPSVPDRAGEGGGPVSPAELARGLRAFLRRVPAGTGSDAAAKEQILAVLDRVEATLHRRTHFDAAVTILRRHLEIRVRAPEPEAAGPDEGGAPWSSAGGHLHLSDFEHGGFTGRRAVFVVGLDADRVPGGGTQDPVLGDAERQALGGRLPTSADTLHERIFRLSALLARLRGTVTFSYGAWNASEARQVSPSTLLLQALRLEERDPALTFEDLHRALGPVACAVPHADAPALDTDDVWMKALSHRGLLRDGMAAVRGAFPRLDGGLAAEMERAAGAAGPWHGVVQPRPEVFDPRRNPEIVLSASRLEDLGTCPLRYLYKGVLHLYPPDDPELDPDRWLDALRRGSLLHAVFEGTLREAKARGMALADAGFEALSLDVLARHGERARAQVPAPGEGVRQRELAGLAEDVRSFVRMVREHGAPWVKLEMRFGLGDDEPMVIPLTEGEVRLRGAVDRVDEDLQGLHVIDYKTGTPRDYEGGTGAFHGGRRLQHALYAMVAEELLSREVVAGEYHFPTRKGENRVVRFDRFRLEGVAGLLDRLLDGVGAGTFVPTDDGGDCRFCDYAAACRARALDWGKTESPLADWSAERMDGFSPALEHLRKARTYED
jgi:hypothetical protein